MDMIRTRALRGPNLWSRHTALEMEVRCEPDERSVDSRAGFEDRLRALCPGLGTLRTPTRHGAITLAHALESTLLALQAAAGCPVTFSHTEPTAEDGVFLVVVEYTEEAVARRALEMVQRIVRAAWSPETALPEAANLDGMACVTALRELDEDLRLGPSTGAIVSAAVSRGIPFRRLTTGSLVQFGWGHKQRRIQAAEVDNTSAVAEAIAQDKDLTKHLLQSAAVPVPIGAPAATAAEAWAMAERIGLPVVVKPQDGSQGRGVTVNITTRAQLDAAFATAAEIGDVLVEKFLPGSDFRLLVVGDRLVAAARRDPPHVIGDGRHTVRELVDIVNADPRRGSGHATSLTKIRFDDIAKARLVQQDLTPESVPEKGRRVVLRNNANLSTGGSATDVTDDVHPEVAARAVDAARMVGLHVCGVDVVCETVQRPLEDQSGGIVEVNAAPGLRMHLNPSYGKGRDIGNPIVSELYKPGDDGRIPLVAVTGVNGKTTTTRMIAHVLAAQALCVGMTNTDGVYVGGRQTDSGDCSGPKSARNVLSHPHVQAAVLECARGGILREGLGFDRCSVAVVTNVGTGDHLGLNHIHSVEGIARVKKVIVQNVAPSGYAVLNAADPLVAAMADECPGQVIYFARDSHHPRIASHRARGRRVVFVEKGDLVAVEGKLQHRLPLSAVPITHGGAIGFQVENTLAAVAACWGLNMEWADIVKGVSSFVNNADNAPGRFNMMNYRGATLVADYGHNPDAINALVQAFNALPIADDGKRTVVISGAGDRRDEDLREQTRILGDSFDQVILYEDQCQRGRADWEVVKIMREGLQGASRTTHIEEIRGEFVAIDAALSLLKGGDQCLILVDQVEQALAYLEEKCRS
ncbi:MAG: cyanophycin synthetase [Betaproteobacteria bacterium]|nr:cyanophycin synthetase [Betaproteobacteria bacterium]NBX95911.1 cyanophycin synthetase [Betaproteobacteria bacterium]